MTATMQVRVTTGRQQVLVEGPDDADLVLTVARAEMGTDPSVLFMTGKLKATGTAGDLFDALANGRVADALRRLASQF